MLEDLILTLAITGGIAAGVASMYFKYNIRQRYFEERAKLIDAMRETGDVDLEKLKQLQDPEILNRLMYKGESKGFRFINLIVGILLLAVAIATWAFLGLYVVAAEGEHPAIQASALFPGLLGIAFLIIHVIVTPKKGENGNGKNDMTKF